jgi:hypothetical protein
VRSVTGYEVHVGPARAHPVNEQPKIRPVLRTSTLIPPSSPKPDLTKGPAARVPQLQRGADYPQRRPPTRRKGDAERGPARELPTPAARSRPGCGLRAPFARALADSPR